MSDRYDLRKRENPFAAWARPTPPVIPNPNSVYLCDVNARRVHWLWPGRIPLGKLTLLVGDPGLGKSFITLDMAARVSRGAAWPDETGVSGAVAGFLSSHDSSPDDETWLQKNAATAPSEVDGGEVEGSEFEGPLDVQPAGKGVDPNVVELLRLLNEGQGPGQRQEDTENSTSDSLRVSMSCSGEGVAQPPSAVQRSDEGVAQPPSTVHKPGGVILLSAEDGIADTIRPRLEAAGADLEKIQAITCMNKFNPEDCSHGYEPFSLATHIKSLGKATYEMGDARLIIIDPISAYLGGDDFSGNARLRKLLGPLSQLAAELNVAIVAVTHLRKGGGPAMYRALGSVAFVAAARSAYGVMKDKDDPTGARRLFLPLKNNLCNAQGLAYRLDDSRGGAPLVAWESQAVTIDADEAMMGSLRRERERNERSQVKEAAAWLADALSSGPMHVKLLMQLASRDGISRGTLIRAKDRLNTQAFKTTGSKFSGWSWRLPDPSLKE